MLREVNLELSTEEHLEHWESVTLWRLEEKEETASSFPGAVCWYEMFLAGEMVNIQHHLNCIENKSI